MTPLFYYEDMFSRIIKLWYDVSFPVCNVYNISCLKVFFPAGDFIGLLIHTAPNYFYMSHTPIQATLCGLMRVVNYAILPGIPRTRTLTCYTYLLHNIIIVINHYVIFFTYVIKLPFKMNTTNVAYLTTDLQVSR